MKDSSNNTIFKVDGEATNESERVKIGGFTVANNKLYNGSDEAYVELGTEAIILGGTNADTAPFSVKNDGTLYATKANIEGDITAKNLTLDIDATIGGSLHSNNFTMQYPTIMDEAIITNPKDVVTYIGNTNLGLTENYNLKIEGELSISGLKGTVSSVEIVSIAINFNSSLGQSYDLPSSYDWYISDNTIYFEFETTASQTRPNGLTSPVGLTVDSFTVKVTYIPDPLFSTSGLKINFGDNPYLIAPYCSINADGLAVTQGKIGGLTISDDGSITSANSMFQIDAAGNMKTTSGEIGNFIINDDGLISKDSALSIRQDSIVIGQSETSVCEICYDNEKDNEKILFNNVGGKTRFVCGGRTSDLYFELSSDKDSVSTYNFVVQAARYQGTHDGNKDYKFCYAYRLAMTGGTRPYATYVTVTFHVYASDEATKRTEFSYQFVIPANLQYSDWYTNADLNDPYGWFDNRSLKVSWSNGITGDWFPLYSETAPLNPSYNKLNNTVDISTILSLKLTNGSKAGAIEFHTNCIPTDTNTYDLGIQGNAWKDLFLSGSAYNSGGGHIDLSDANCKNSIAPLSDAHSQVFDNLKPITYKYNKGTSNRLHTGFIAQDVKAAIEAAGLTTQDFAAYCEWEGTDGSTTCGLRYSELIALCVSEIQKLKKRVEKQDTRIEELKRLVKELKT